MSDLLEDAVKYNDNYYTLRVGKYDKEHPYHANPYWSSGVGRFPILNAVDQNFTQVLVIEVKNETEEIIAQSYGSHAKVNAHRFIESNIKYYKWINELATQQQKEKEIITEAVDEIKARKEET